MFHPLFKLLASRPDLVMDHLSAYLALISAQAGGAVRGLRTRAMLGIVMGLCMVLAVALGGMALLLFAAVPPERMNLPWLLWVVPGVPLLVGAAAWAALRSRGSEWSLGPLRSQIESDAALLREAGEA